MHVLMLSWEYPPLIVGGIANHVHDLAGALARRGVEVSVVTAATDATPAYEEPARNLRVIRTRLSDIWAYDFQTGIMHLNFALAGEAMGLAARHPIDVVHAHDWLVAYAAESVRRATHAPLIGTIHATELGRNNGLHTQQQHYIHNVEWWLTYQSWRVICCSEYMRDHIQHVFSTPWDKVRVIYNGVDSSAFSVEVPPGFRSRYAAEDEKIVFFIGRMVREKGLQILVEAAPKILHHHPRTKFVIAGGGDSSAHRRRVAELGVGHAFYFTGYVPDEDVPRLYAVADVAAFPSLYEPFGIVALEAMAAGTPLVASDVGGLGSIVRNGQNGLTCYPDNPDSLGWQILDVLLNPGPAAERAQQAASDVRTLYDWNRLAEQTESVYREVL